MNYDVHFLLENYKREASLRMIPWTKKTCYTKIDRKLRLSINKKPISDELANNDIFYTAHKE